MGDVSNEPSMEEILSSIKRIIAEDTEAALTPPRGKRVVAGQTALTPLSGEPPEEPEVLELTQTVDTPHDTAKSAPAPKAQAKAEPVAHDAAVTPELVSEATVSASRSSLAALSALVVKPEVTGADTLEGLVREMIKPMLSEWLEAKLPDVVERLVAQEIRRITDRG